MNEKKKTSEHKCRLSSLCAHDFSKYIQLLQEKCYLKHLSNAFKIGERKSSVWWRGVFMRESENCRKFIFTINDWSPSNQFVLINCSIEGELNHTGKSIFQYYA